MDLNYNVNMQTSSLKTMSAVRVALQLLETRKTPKNTTETWAFSERYEHDRIKKLNLLPCLQDVVSALIMPMFKELRQWHKDLLFNIRPSWTSCGSIDVMRSTEIFLKDETVESRIRYLVACNFCHEKYVFRLGKNLNKDLLSVHRILYYAPSFYALVMKNVSPLVELWLEIIHAHGGLQCPNQQLLQQLYIKGIECAVTSKNDFALDYFIGKASKEVITNMLQERPNLLINERKTCFPETHCLLFSKLHWDVKDHYEAFFSGVVLKSLLQWPYQRFFVLAGRALIFRLTTRMYCELLKDIFHKTIYDFDGYDYRDILAYAWKMGAAQRRSANFSVYLQDILDLVMYLKEDYITCLFFRDVSPNDNEAIQNYFATRCYWQADLAYGSMFWSINVCDSSCCSGSSCPVNTRRRIFPLEKRIAQFEAGFCRWGSMRQRPFRGRRDRLLNSRRSQSAMWS